MIIVDDRVSLDVLAGRTSDAEPVATTWAFHYRLLRALTDTRRGSLAAVATSDARRIAARPPEDILVVLDPRTVTAEAAVVAARHNLNLLAAELIASALHHQAVVRVSAANVGRQWPAVMAAEGITLETV